MIPLFTLYLKGQRFDPVLIFLYREPTIPYLTLFARAWAKAVLDTKVAWYVETGIFPEMSLN